MTVYFPGMLNCKLFQLTMMSNVDVFEFVGAGSIEVLTIGVMSLPNGSTILHSMVPRISFSDANLATNEIFAL